MADLKDIIKDIKEKYNRDVKPNIESNPFMAGMEMANIKFILDEYAEKIEIYHSGPGMLTSTTCLQEELMEGKPVYPTNFYVREFEMKINQLELSIKSGNIG